MEDIYVVELYDDSGKTKDCLREFADFDDAYYCAVSWAEKYLHEEHHYNNLTGTKPTHYRVVKNHMQLYGQHYLYHGNHHHVKMIKMLECLK